MAFTPTLKVPGDLVKSQDWNDTINEIVRLDNAKVDRAGDTIAGALSVSSTLTVSGDLKLAQGVAINEFSSDDTLTDNSDLAIPTEKAVRTYVNVHVARTDNPHNTTAAQVGALPIAGGTLNGGLTVNGSVGIGVAPAYLLDVGGRMRIRSIGNLSNSAGIWFDGYSYTSPSKEAAFVGMRSADEVGFYGLTGAGDWRLWVNTTTGNLQISSALAFKPGGGAWANSSDERLKNNIQPLTNALDQLLKLRGVTYEWKEPEKQGNLTGTQIGLIAQEVEPVFPDWVGVDTDGYKTLSIRGFEALTVEALKTLKAENEQLKQRCNDLEAKLETLLNRLPIAT